MNAQQADALAERVSELSCLCNVLDMLKASTSLDSDAADVLTTIHLHLVHLTNRLDANTTEARRAVQTAGGARG